MLVQRDEVRIQPVLLNSAFASNILTSDNTDNSDGDTVTVGGKTYTFKTALTEAKATATLTSNNTNVSEDDTVTINGVTYTFRATPRNANDIQIGASADASLGSLAHAINGDGTVGTDYFTGTQPVPGLSSSTVSAHAITLTANAIGTAANSYGLATTAATLTPSGAHLAGGLASVANEVLIDGTADGSLTNLEYAINGTTAHAGVKYSTATVKNSIVSCSGVTSHAVTVTALNPGQALNTSACSVSASHLSWGTTTLMGGYGGLISGSVLGNTASTFYSEPINVQRLVELIAFLNVTAHAGTNPTLDISFQYSTDGLTWMDSGDAFTQVTTSDSETLKRLTANFGKWLRVKVVTGGTTPVYTIGDFSIMGKS